jgi:ABC-2 type transport system ATP-binding protein
MSELSPFKHDGGAVVEVDGLTVKFGDFAAVKNVRFSVNRGEIFGFLGANGAGKTTTIRVLCGLLTPTEGIVRVAGCDFSDGGLALKRKVGYMSQRFTLYDDLTIDENLLFASQLRKMDDTVFRRRRRELLDFISFKRDSKSLVKDLPGGLKQQVSLAAALLHDPEVVFLDEPTAGVTPASRERFWALIRQIAERGHTVFVTTHYMDEAEQCGRIALMRNGELIALDSPERLKHAAFPRGLIELEPRDDRVARAAARLEGHPALSLFEPYGMRYHVEVADQELWLGLKEELERDYFIHEIKPTLEDVFIRRVEGG